MSGGGGGYPGGSKDSVKIKNLEKLIKQVQKEVDEWPEWLKKNAEAIFVTKRDKNNE